MKLKLFGELPRAGFPASTLLYLRAPFTCAALIRYRTITATRDEVLETKAAIRLARMIFDSCV